MKRTIVYSFVLPIVIVQSALFAADPTQFMATVQLAVDETSPQLTERSQRLVQTQFARTFETWPELQGKHYDVKTVGNEVVFYLVTDDDMRAPMQRAVSSMIQRLNGRVRARGRSLFYKTPLTANSSGYLDVGVDDTHSKILYTSAQAVPLRGLLREIKAQLGGALSFLIPGECADRLVDWNFGDPMHPNTPKTVDAAMGELATLFNLKYEKKNQTHIFSGGCNEAAPRGPRTTPMPGPWLRTGLQAGGGGFRPTVYFPLSPMGGE